MLVKFVFLCEIGAQINAFRIAAGEEDGEIAVFGGGKLLPNAYDAQKATNG